MISTTTKKIAGDPKEDKNIIGLYVMLYEFVQNWKIVQRKFKTITRIEYIGIDELRPTNKIEKKVESSCDFMLDQNDLKEKKSKCEKHVEVGERHVDIGHICTRYKYHQ